MTTLFFLTSLLFGWIAWNLYHPNFTSMRLGLVSFVAGLVAGELALHTIFWQVMIVAFFALFGAISGLFGALGLLIGIASWAAIAFKYYESTYSKSEVKQSLIDGLGEDYEKEIDEEFRLKFGQDPDRDLIRHPLRRDDSQVELIAGVPFGDFGRALDIRRGKSSTAERLKPVLLQIHGGGWTYGRRDDGQGLPLMNHMAKRDWICVASSYRLSPMATFPDHIIDCKQALVWIKDHIEEYGGDPNFIVVTGGSAGAHLSSLLAYHPNHPEFQPGFEDRDTSVQGVIPFYGLYDLTDSDGLQHHEGTFEFLEDSIFKLDISGNEETYQQASPWFHVDENAPPSFVIHGQDDTLIPVECARSFTQKLSGVSKNKVVYLEVAGAQHAFDLFPSMRSEYVKFGVEKFLAWTYSQYLKSV